MSSLGSTLNGSTAKGSPENSLSVRSSASDARSSNGSPRAKPPASRLMELLSLFERRGSLLTSSCTSGACHIPWACPAVVHEMAEPYAGPRWIRHSPFAYAQPHCLCTVPLPMHSPYVQPPCICTVPLPMPNPIACAQPPCLCTAPLPIHSPIAHAQSHCLCTAPLPVSNPSVITCQY